KAAVSRQREFLADASAVHYTRNPQGIAGALWKIGKFASRLESPRAQEASHMFFGNGVRDPWLALFATHPPLDERIHAIDPGFQPVAVTETPAEAVPEPPSPRQAGMPVIGGILASLPAFAAESVRDLHGACAFVYALLLDERDAIREVQLAALRVEPALLEETLALYARRGEMAVTHKLPLVDLVIPTLRHLSPAQYAEFRGNVTRLVESDRVIHLFEYALQKTLIRHLDLSFTRTTGTRVRFRSVVALLPEIAVLLTGIAQADHADPALRDAAFSAGVRELLINQKPEIVADCNLSQIDAALDRIAEASPDVKRAVLKACSAASAHDGVVGVEEYELLRAIADTLDCPLPPHLA
ncbi:MAG TPA: M48 family metalloprotease, partial [Terrimicrobiaceae bacterium]|nr:M48 family metalloprotease [Terrimicrobiaceae bacterium]